MADRPTWRCYFCDEVFTTPGGAADHFGATLADKPGCLIDYQVQVEAGINTQRGRGLLMALRKAEAELMRYGSEDTDLHRYMHRQQSEHQQALRREEEKGYARGLRDGVNLSADSPERASIAGVAIPLNDEPRARVTKLRSALWAIETNMDDADVLRKMAHDALEEDDRGR